MNVVLGRKKGDLSQSFLWSVLSIICLSASPPLQLRRLKKPLSHGSNKPFHACHIWARAIVHSQYSYKTTYRYDGVFLKKKKRLSVKVAMSFIHKMGLLHVVLATFPYSIQYNNLSHIPSEF